MLARIGRWRRLTSGALGSAKKNYRFATTQRLVQEIAWGVVNGLRDEDALANAALERTHIDETPPI